MKPRRFSLSGVLLLAVVVLLGWSSSVIAELGEPPLAVRLTPFTSGLKQPVAFAHDPTGRVFVVEQEGRIQWIDQQRPRLYLDITDRVAAGGECGLLGLAFDPGYAKNGFFYVNYTTRKNGRLETVVSRFEAKPMLPRVDAGTEKEVLRFPQPYTNHNGGQIAFGPDGMLYIGVGDGGSANDPELAGQDLSTWLGKILRIDVSKPPYRVPGDNPFVGNPKAKPEIWAYGLRNPWRFSFDRKTGQLWAADVGQNQWEEIDLITKGGNYGWSAKEGSHPFRPERGDGQPMIDPVKEYSHKLGQSITGGYVYRGKGYPKLEGVYFYADFVSRRLWGLRRGGAGEPATLDAELMRLPFPISSFGEDRDGEIYLLDYEDGRVFRLGM